MRFDDSVVLITGAGHGLGAAFARCIAGAGSKDASSSTTATVSNTKWFTTPGVE